MAIKKDETQIVLKRDTKKDLMLFKIHTNAKNLDEVLKKAIKLLEKELKWTFMSVFLAQLNKRGDLEKR